MDILFILEHANNVDYISTNEQVGANLVSICLHINTPESLFGLAKARRATLQAIEAKLITI
jgi:hypothetical protein